MVKRLKSVPMYNSQPSDWIAAFEKQAERAEMSFSKWIGECLLANLDRDLAKGLSERAGVGNPQFRKKAKK